MLQSPPFPRRSHPAQPGADRFGPPTIKRSGCQMVVLELSASDGHHISSYQGSINQIPFLLHALGFPQHCSQVLLYLPPIQLRLPESLAQDTCMSKASLHLFLIVAMLWLPILFHQSGSKVLVHSSILSHKAFHLLARYFREYFIYLVYLSVRVHNKTLILRKVGNKRFYIFYFFIITIIYTKMHVFDTQHFTIRFPINIG